MRGNQELIEFLDFVVRAAVELDSATSQLSRAKLLVPWRAAKTPEEKRLRSLILHGAGAKNKISRFHQLVAEMATCRLVDNFLIYLSDLLAMIFSSKPETLRSKEEVTLELVLSHPTRAKLIKALVERKVNQLSYQGMRDVVAFTSKRLGLELFPIRASLERAVFLVEIRNVIVHNRAIVNDIFMQRVSDGDWQRGQATRITISQIQGHVIFLTKCVQDIELRAHTKFGISVPVRKARADLNTR